MRKFDSIKILAEIITFVLVVLLLLTFRSFFPISETRKYKFVAKNDVKLGKIKLILVVSVSVINLLQKINTDIA